VRPAWAAGFGSVARVGACVLAVALLPDGAVVCANAGDCRAVLGRTDPANLVVPPAVAAAAALSAASTGTTSASAAGVALTGAGGAVGAGGDSGGGPHRATIAALFRARSEDAAPSTTAAPGGAGTSACAGAGGATAAAWASACPAYEAVALSRDHNAREPYEQARLGAAHPDERLDMLVQCVRPGVRLPLAPR